MPVVKLTLPFLKSVELPTSRQVFYFDSGLPRFGVSVFPSGRKTFFIKYQTEYGKTRWLSIGKFPLMTLEQAREIAREKLVAVDQHKDPASDKYRKRNAKTVSELCDLYLFQGVAHKKSSTIESDRGRIETLIKPLIGDIPVENLTRGEIITMMNDIIKGNKIRKHEPSSKPRGVRRVSGGAGAATRTIQTLGAILTFAKNQGLISENFVQGIKTPKAKIRDVFLNWDEVQLLGQILSLPEIDAIHHTACNIIKLILLTGCRRGEILGLRWDYVDFENQVFRFPDTKTGKQNRPFGIAARQLLEQIQHECPATDENWVFPSKTGTGHMTDLLRTFKTICSTKDPVTGRRILSKDNLTLHALRHTFASLGADLGYSEIIIAALLGHHLGTVTNRYTHTVDKSLIAAADTISTKINEHLNLVQQK